MVASVTAAGTITQTTRGGASLADQLGEARRRRETAGLRS